MKRLRRLTVLFCALAVIYIASAGGFDGIARQFFSFEYRAEITMAAEANGLDECFVAAMCMTESGFDENASSGVAYGLMQITDETAEFVADRTGLEFEKRLEPKTNIEMGAWYFKYLCEKFKDEETALAAYNAGPGKVTSWLADSEYSDDGVALKKIPYKETRDYIRKVRWFYKIYASLYK